MALGLAGILVIALAWSLLRSSSQGGDETEGAPEGSAETVAQTDGDLGAGETEAVAVAVAAPASFPDAVLTIAPASDPPPLEDVVENVLPAIVSIASTRGTGSGFFVDRDTVVTNLHVTGDDDTVEIKMQGGHVVSGRVERVSTEHDLALIHARFPLEGHGGLPLAAVDDVKVGQDVIVIGSPLGVLDSSVSRGIVSAIRPVDEVTFIQTDAAINSGNSGGPVLDRYGRVIGVATMKLAEGENLGFAVVSDHVEELLNGGGRRADGRGREPARSVEPTSLDDLTAAEHEPVLERILLNYEAALGKLFEQTSQCPDLVPRLEGKREEEVYHELGELVLEYVNQRRIYARVGRYIPEWSGMSCLRKNEKLVTECYEALVVYDTAYKSYVSKSAQRGLATRVPRRLPEI